MKYGNLPAVLSILIAAFVVAVIASQFLAGTGNILSSIPILGGVLPCTVGVDCPTLTVTTDTASIYIYVNTNANIPESSAITVTEPGTSSSCQNHKIQFFSNVAGWFSNGNLGSASSSYPYCNLDSTCSCTINFHSLSTTGIATIVASDINNPTGIAPGQTNVEIQWPATPCIGIVAPCSNTNTFSTSASCTGQQGCAWFNPNPNYVLPSCVVPYIPGIQGNYGPLCSRATTQSVCQGTTFYANCCHPTCGPCGGPIACQWNPADAALYPGCFGTVAYDCGPLSISACGADFRCQWSGNTCVKRPCSSWSADNANCALATGCSYSTTPCAGTASDCTTFNTQSGCSLQNGCSWVGYNPSATTTTTTTTTVPTTTTTTIMTTTTTTTPSASFSGSNFQCVPRSGGYNCSMVFNNNLGESAVIVFIVSDSPGNTISSVAYTVPVGSGIAQTNYFCTNSANYYMSWEAYRSSDTSFSNPVAFSSPGQKQLMSC